MYVTPAHLDRNPNHYPSNRCGGPDCFDFLDAATVAEGGRYCSDECGQLALSRLIDDPLQGEEDEAER